MGPKWPGGAILDLEAICDLFMASLVTQSDQTVEVLAQFWSKMGPNGSKLGTKMGPTMGLKWPQNGPAGALWGPCYGAYRGAL